MTVARWAQWYDQRGGNGLGGTGNSGAGWSLDRWGIVQGDRLRLMTENKWRLMRSAGWGVYAGQMQCEQLKTRKPHHASTIKSWQKEALQEIIELIVMCTRKGKHLSVKNNFFWHADLLPVNMPHSLIQYLFFSKVTATVCSRAFNWVKTQWLEWSSAGEKMDLNKIGVSYRVDLSFFLWLFPFINLQMKRSGGDEVIGIVACENQKIDGGILTVPLTCFFGHWN